MTFEVREGIEGLAGTKEYFSLNVGELPNGADVLMPVMVVTGVEDGPTFFVNACLHGDEILGSDVVRRSVQNLEPNEMRGRLIAVPFANPPAVGTRTRRNTSEMYPGPHDMNRVFPGEMTGIMAERLASILVERFILPSDYAFDIHCASVGGSWEPYAAIPSVEACSSQEVANKSAELARSFGTPTLLDGHVTHGSFVEPAVKAGVVASMAEFGVANVIDSANLELGLRGVSNLLKYAGLIDGEPNVPENQHVLKKLHRMKTEKSGYLIHHVSLGDAVEEGHLLAEIEDLSGGTVARFTAPVAGRICRQNTMGVVGTGDLIVYVATTE